MPISAVFNEHSKKAKREFWPRIGYKLKLLAKSLSPINLTFGKKSLLYKYAMAGQTSHPFGVEPNLMFLTLNQCLSVVVSVESLRCCKKKKPSIEGFFLCVGRLLLVHLAYCVCEGQRNICVSHTG